MTKLILLLSISWMSLSSQAQGENKNLIVKYKQYESFD
jgi:hypothetical protein